MVAGTGIIYKRLFEVAHDFVLFFEKHLRAI